MIPVRKSCCAPWQFFVKHTFEKTRNTEAAVTPKPALHAPALVWVGSFLSGSGGPPVSRQAQRPSGAARKVALAKVAC